ncbi:L-ascorbate oxidase homolog [Prosopis cineraria]|uniref:L-ascorbate oxidase homolog n=1 Tax=Prosopis cineraria TaxID=364024 RepID=UPI00240EE26F|nr:L-ascorbate oxidase homolog [Prosopis cineraria]
MKRATFQVVLVGVLACLSALHVGAEDPYRFFTWEVTYGTIYPLGFPQQGILINGQFPGPTVEAVTNDNIIVNVINKLDEPFLITWNGIQQRKTSWQDGVLGTNCPIPPNSNWTYKFQVKDQIGTYNYFPSIRLHRVAGGFGGFNIAQRSVISIPYDAPAAEFTLLVSDWFKTSHKLLAQRLGAGLTLPYPDALLINGQRSSSVFTGQPGKTYKLRVSNVGIATSINLRIEGHAMKLIEVEGSHTMQEMYDSLDVHVGQSVTVLVTLNASPKDYYIVASGRFIRKNLTAVAALRYEGSNIRLSGPLPPAPSFQFHGSMKQARTIRWNLTANAARPNPQGSYHYGTIPVARTVILANSKASIDGKQRFAVNGISYVNPDTPLKLADWLNISGVFNLNTIKDFPPSPDTPATLGTSVLGFTLHDFVEIIFQNTEHNLQSWHMDGSSFFVAAYGSGTWKPELRRRYNLVDGVFRHTVQVYPKGWTAILVPWDNKGMWNLRSAVWSSRYLGQELYLRVYNDEKSLFTETDIPPNALFCGKAKPQ